MLLFTRPEMLERLKRNKRHQGVLFDMYGKGYEELSDEVLAEFIKNRETMPLQLTLEETSRVIDRKVPEEMRLKSVYIPILAVIIAMRKFSEAVGIITSLRVQSVKKTTREMKALINEYDSDLYHVMSSDLYKQVQRAVDNMTGKGDDNVFGDISTFLTLFDNTLYSEAVDNDADYEDLTDIVVKMLSAIEFGKFANSLDEKYAAMINEACGDMVHYTFHKDERLATLIADAEYLVSVIDLPNLMESKRVNDAKDKLFSLFNNVDVHLINKL